jgi:short-subunit dehydrogenase
MTLSGKSSIIVTGASSGIGRAASIKLVERGYQVFGLARSFDKLSSLFPSSASDQPPKFHAKRIENLFVPIKCDITKPETFDNILDTIVSKSTGNKLLGLVNNAGYVEPGAIEDLDMKNLRYQFEVNFFGLIGFAKRVLPLMMQQKRDVGATKGRIVNISSISGLISLPLIGAYSATKHALEAVSGALRTELWNTGIKVITINPGVIETNIYGPLQTKTLDLINSNKQSRFIGSYNKYLVNKHYYGLSADVVADVICNAISSPQPRQRYIIGSEKEKIITKLMPFIPDGLFNSSVAKQLNPNS